MSNEAKPNTIMEANAREIHIIEFLAGLDAQLFSAQDILRERLKLVPNGWRNFRLALTTTEKVVEAVYNTLPQKTLRHMAKLSQFGDVVIRPKPMVKLPDDVQIVTNDDLRVILNALICAATAAACTWTWWLEMSLGNTFRRKDMAKDVLTIAQLEAQLARREEKLEYLKAGKAPPEAIRIATADLRLTQRRLERARAADYDEEIARVRQIGPTGQF